MRWPLGSWWITTAAVSGLIVHGSAVAQDAPGCRRVSSEVTLGPLSGRRIDSVDIVTQGPALPERLPAFVSHLHVRSRPAVIRRELLFQAGDTIDTLRVAESLRRLRGLPYLQFARVVGVDCATAEDPSSMHSPIRLIVETQDGWSTRPDLKVGARSPKVGLTERNVLGTGRTLGIDLVSDAGQLGVATTIADPMGFGTGTVVQAESQHYRSGTVDLLSVARRQLAIDDRWRAEGTALQVNRTVSTDPGAYFKRHEMSLIGGVRVSPEGAGHVVYLLSGLSAESAHLFAAHDSTILGPARVNRSLAIPVVGASIAPSVFDTLTWLLPNHAIVDVPRGLQGEVVVGIGRGRESMNQHATDVQPAIGTAHAITHVDGWLGRTWLPSPRSRVVADVWGMGYGGQHEWHASTVRAQITADHAAAHGTWNLTLAAEQLTDPDPDVHALALADRLLAYIPTQSRFAEAAATVSLERIRHLHRVGSAFALDGSLFAAFTRRWEPAEAAAERDNVGVGAVGVGLRLTPTRQNVGSIRLDLGFPTWASSGLSRRPRVTISIAPALESLQHRLGIQVP